MKIRGVPLLIGRFVLVGGLTLAIGIVITPCEIRLGQCERKLHVEEAFSLWWLLLVLAVTAWATRDTFRNVRSDTWTIGQAILRFLWTGLSVLITGPVALAVTGALGGWFGFRVFPGEQSLGLVDLWFWSACFIVVVGIATTALLPILSMLRRG